MRQGLPWVCLTPGVTIHQRGGRYPQHRFHILPELGGCSTEFRPNAVVFVFHNCCNHTLGSLVHPYSTLGFVGIDVRSTLQAVCPPESASLSSPRVCGFLRLQRWDIGGSRANNIRGGRHDAWHNHMGQGSTRAVVSEDLSILKSILLCLGETGCDWCYNMLMNGPKRIRAWPDPLGQEMQWTSRNTAYHIVAWHLGLRNEAVAG